MLSTKWLLFCLSLNVLNRGAKLQHNHVHTKKPEWDNEHFLDAPFKCIIFKRFNIFIEILLNFALMVQLTISQNHFSAWLGIAQV